MCRFCRRTIAGVEDVQQVGQNLDDGLAAGQRLVAQVVDVLALRVGGHERFGDFGQAFFETNVGGHNALRQIILVAMFSGKADFNDPTSSSRRQ